MNNDYHRKWRSDNKDKVKSANDKFSKSEKRKEYLKEYRETDKFKEYKKDYDEKHREKAKAYDKKYREANPEKARERFRKYDKTTKGTAKMLRRHDAKRLGIQNNKFTYKIIEMINERDKVCVYCGCELNGNVDHDHINPFSKFSKYNIVRCCSSCNKDKSRADMIQWMNFKGYKISDKLKELYKKAYKNN